MYRMARAHQGVILRESSVRQIANQSSAHESGFVERQVRAGRTRRRNCVNRHAAQSLEWRRAAYCAMKSQSNPGICMAPVFGKMVVLESYRRASFSMSNAPCVTIGVPVYQGEPFIQEALRSIQNQTHRNIKVIISLDGPQAASERLCRPFLKDRRFRLVVQAETLGWVGNSNYLMAQVETPYWIWHPHDDLLDPMYVEVLLNHAERSPEAAVVYCDIAVFGSRTGTLVQSCVTGDAITRQVTLLREHFNAVALRGLTRVEALRHSGGMRPNEVDSFAADTTWMAAVARWGELQRVPLELYRKRYHSENESMNWQTWPAEKLRQAWIAHCADMLEQAMLVQATAHDRHRLWLATVARLVSPRGVSWIHPVVNLTLPERVLLFDAFFLYLQTARAMELPAWLQESWDEIQRSAKHDLVSIMEIKTSRAWRAGLLMRRLLLILAPSNSRRARALRPLSHIIARLLS